MESNEESFQDLLKKSKKEVLCELLEELYGFALPKYFKKENVLDKGYVELIDGSFSEPKLKIVNSARVSFLKQSDTLTKKDVRLIKFLDKEGHYSTFRHSYYSFRIKAPLSVFRQWWKYQIGSDWIESTDVGVIEVPETNWNEASSRYVVLEPEFYIPKSLRNQSKDNKQGSEGVFKMDGVDAVSFYEDACRDQYARYRRLVDAGAAKEQCRMMLPQGIYSECIWTISLQGLLFFFDQRLKKDAQKEIREYAQGIWKLVEPFLGDFKKENWKLED